MQFVPEICSSCQIAWFNFTYMIKSNHKNKGWLFMISKVSSNILNYLIRNEVINDTEEERNYYQYGIEITISSALNFFLVFLIGAVTRNILESIVFMIFFVPIRQITGGYHAKTYFRCNLYLCMVFVSILLLYRFTNEYITSYNAMGWRNRLVNFNCMIWASKVLFICYWWTFNTIVWIVAEK